MMFGRGRSDRDRAILRQKVVALAAKGPGRWFPRVEPAVRGVPGGLAEAEHLRNLGWCLAQADLPRRRLLSGLSGFQVRNVASAACRTAQAARIAARAIGSGTSPVTAVNDSTVPITVSACVMSTPLSSAGPCPAGVPGLVT